jgi:hypothetical protein
MLPNREMMQGRRMLIAAVITLVLCHITNRLFDWFDNDPGTWELPLEALLFLVVWIAIYWGIS